VPLPLRNYQATNVLIDQAETELIGWDDLTRQEQAIHQKLVARPVGG